MKEKGKIQSVVAIRGVAVLLVMLYHFFSERALNIAAHGLNDITWAFGHIGVTLFFIVSGFVLPYSMYRSDYHIRQFPRFLYRRAVRIEPPYIISILIVLLCMLGKYIIGQNVNYAGGTLGIFTQLLYLNDILGLPWLNVVYWTLALEFQFYLLVGIVFPLFRKSSSLVLILGLSLLCALKFLTVNYFWVFYFLPFFVSGYAICAYKLGEIKSEHLIGLIAICCIINCYGNDAAYIVIDIGTVLLFTLLFFMERVQFPKWLLFVGEISYSVYLVHNIVVAGLGVLDPLNLALDIRILLSVIAFFLAFIPSYLLYRYVEKPFHLMARKIPR